MAVYCESYFIHTWNYTYWIFVLPYSKRPCLKFLVATTKTWGLFSHADTAGKLRGRFAQFIYKRASSHTPSNSTTVAKSYINPLTLILLTWRIWWAPNNAIKWQMGFNSAFKGLNAELNPICHLLALLLAHHILHVSRRRFKPPKSTNRFTINQLCFCANELTEPFSIPHPCLRILSQQPSPLTQLPRPKRTGNSQNKYFNSSPLKNRT